MSMRSFRPAVTALALAVLTACDSATVTDPATSSLATPEMAVLQASPASLQWQQKARQLATQGNMNPIVAARVLAATGMAAMRAVEEVDALTAAPVDGTSGAGYGAGGRSRYEARRGAVAGASARVLGWFVPAASAELEAMMAAQSASAGKRVHPDFLQGAAIGGATGDEVIAHVMNDRLATPWTGTVPVGPGLWIPSALPPGGGMMGQVEPWFLESGSQFRPGPPPAYLSAEFNADLAEVLALAATRTPAQVANAIFWHSGVGSHTPIGYWNELAATYVAAAGSDEREAARVFALTSAAMFDALIALFEAKYHYWTLRPHQADPALTTVVPVPNYPAYPSGHGTVSAAAARVLASFFPQRAAELDALVTDAALSRIVAGLHYRFDMTSARTMGEQIADFIITQAAP